MKKYFTLSIMLVMIIFTNKANAQDIIYVDQNATGNSDGTSWQDAYNTISDGVASAGLGDEIWVAKGTYHPATAAQQNNPLLLAVEGIEVRGGFAGTETTLSQRDITKIHTDNSTIISGDYQSNDITGDFASNRSDNASVLVQLAEHGIIIDGFTLKGAQGVGNTSADGNNVIKVSTNINGFTIENCIIKDNYSGYILFDWRSLNTNLAIKNTSITGNTAENGFMLLQHSSSQNDHLNNMFINVLVAENTYFSDWGAIWFRRATSGNSNGMYSFLINCTFANNTNTHSSSFENTINISGDGDNQLSIWNSIFIGNKFQTNNTSTYDIRNNKQSEGNFQTVNFQNSYIGLPGLAGDVSGTSFTNSSPITITPQLDVQHKPIDGSSSIDAGSNALYNQAAYPLTDLAGKTRVVDSSIDAGSYESQGVTCANIVNIPDVNFKNALLNHSPAIDTNNDGIICQDEAEAITNLDVSNKNISDLTGVEAFINLTALNCGSNNLTNIDLSNNTDLTILNIRENNFSSIDLSQLTDLVVLSAFGNSLTTIDVSNNLLLEDFSVGMSNLTQLDLSNHIHLTQIDCYNNNLTSLNLANGYNNNLTYVAIDGNPDLSCVQIDAGFTPNSNWWYDSSVSFSDDCGTTNIEENNANGEKEMKAIIADNQLKVYNSNKLQSVEIINLQGVKLIKSEQPNIDHSNLPNGIYLIRITSLSNNIYFQKMVK